MRISPEPLRALVRRPRPRPTAPRSCARAVAAIWAWSLGAIPAIGIDGTTAGPPPASCTVVSREIFLNGHAPEAIPPAQATPSAEPAQPRMILARRVKEMLLPRAAIVETLPAPYLTTTLPDYLASEFGPQRYHRRREWAGRTGLYEPVVNGQRVWKPIGEVQYVTIHHASMGVTALHPADMIRRIYHGSTDPGGRLNAADVAYHFFVDRNGEVWEGREADRIGTHVGSHPEGLNNRGNIGICGLGSFDQETPPRAMTEAIVDLCEKLARYHGRPLMVRGHADWVGLNGFRPAGGVDCPGRLDRAVRLARERMARLFLPETTLAEAPPVGEDAPAVAGSVTPAPPHVVTLGE